MVLATHPLSGCVVSGASEEGSLLSGSLDVRKAIGQRQRDRRLQGAVWLGELNPEVSLMCRFSR